MSKIILEDSVDQVVASSTAETNVFTGTIQDGVWIGNQIVIEQTGSYQNNNQNGRNYTLRLYVGSSGGSGGTEVTEYTFTTGAASTAHGCSQRWTLFALDADSLRVMHWFSHGGPASDGGNFGQQTNPGGFITNRVEGLSNLDLDTEIRITVTLSTSAANHKFTSKGVFVGLIDPAQAAAASSAPLRKQPHRGMENYDPWALTGWAT